MAITQSMTTSFKAEVLLGVHDFRASGGDTFKLALYTASASLDANTAAYTTSDEVVGTGYTAGGGTLVNIGVTTATDTTSSGTGYATFSNLAFPSATFTARGALIYNTTPSAFDNAGAPLTNPSVIVMDFGSDKTVTAGTFTVTFPSPSSTTTIIRIS